MIRPASWRHRPTEASACALYRLLDADGRLLYVGIALEPRWRLLTHRRKDWGASIDDVRVEWWPNEQMARTAEKVAIRDERPIHNALRYGAAA